MPSCSNKRLLDIFLQKMYPNLDFDDIYLELKILQELEAFYHFLQVLCFRFCFYTSKLISNSYPRGCEAIRTCLKRITERIFDLRLQFFTFEAFPAPTQAENTMIAILVRISLLTPKSTFQEVWATKFCFQTPKRDFKSCLRKSEPIRTCFERITERIFDLRLQFSHSRRFRRQLKLKYKVFWCFGKDFLTTSRDSSL